MAYNVKSTCNKDSGSYTHKTLRGDNIFCIRTFKWFDFDESRGQ